MLGLYIVMAYTSYQYRNQFSIHFPLDNRGRGHKPAPRHNSLQRPFPASNICRGLCVLDPGRGKKSPRYRRSPLVFRRVTTTVLLDGTGADILEMVPPRSTNQHKEPFNACRGRIDIRRVDSRNGIGAKSPLRSLERQKPPMLIRSITKCTLVNDCSFTWIDLSIRKHATLHGKNTMTNY